MYLADIYRVIAAEPKTQIEFLSPLPENGETRDFNPGNNIQMVISIALGSLSPLDDNGCEGENSWLQRTGMTRELRENRAHSFWNSTSHLNTALRMLLEIERPYHFSKHGLRRAFEWRLIRKLAIEVLESMNWDAQSSSFLDLKSKLWPFDD